MKKLSYLLGMFVAALMLSACNEGTDYDIDYTPIAPIGGQYDVIVYSGQDANVTDEQFWATHDINSDGATQLNEYGELYAYLSNTPDYDRDKAWIRVGGYSGKSTYCINAKISINMSDFTFGGTDVDDFVGHISIN